MSAFQNGQSQNDHKKNQKQNMDNGGTNDCKTDITTLMELPYSVHPQRLEQMAEQEIASSEALAESFAFNAEAIQRLTMQKIKPTWSEAVDLKDVSQEPVRKPKRRRKITRVVAAVAACAMLFSLGTAAFATFSTDPQLLQVLHADSQSQIEQLSEMHTALNITDTADGYAVTVKEAIHDRHNTWILIEVEAPQDIVLDEDLVLFHETRVRMEHVSGHGYSIYPIRNSDSNDNRLCFILDFSSRNKLAGQKLTLRLADLQSNLVDEELCLVGAQPLAAGPWEFTLEVPEKDSTVSLWQWRPLCSGAQNVMITRMDVSPLSLTLDMVRLNQRTSGNLDGEQPTVYLKDGTELLLERNSFGSGGTYMQYQYAFPYPIELGEIARIEFCGKKLKW